MIRKCPRCSARNHQEALFCARCGLSLAGEVGEAAGSAPLALRHPDPLQAPPGFRPADGIADLFFRWEAAWGGAMLLGTETIAVIMFNGGYPLEDVVLRIRGLDLGRREAFSKEHALAALPRGRQVTIEVPSYELSAPANDIAVSLVSGRIASVA
ncbi:MAG TPA: zinc ribbon domain-containing protein [Phycisphaerae bacterium]|nr:zinc ribbon domain-containing protein [Phycisphaerae bacterium]